MSVLTLLLEKLLKLLKVIMGYDFPMFKKELLNLILIKELLKLEFLP